MLNPRIIGSNYQRRQLMWSPNVMETYEDESEYWRESVKNTKKLTTDFNAYAGERIFIQPYFLQKWETYWVREFCVFNQERLE
jgi:hypothetical protein